MYAFNDSTVEIPANGAAKLVLKRSGFAATSATEKKFDNFLVDTSNWQPGTYFLQFVSASGEVLATDRLILRQNLETAAADYDPRSDAERVVEAIDAMLANRATAQQRRIQLGDKSIEYSTLSELMSWREHFARIARKEQGKAPAANRQKFIFREC